MMERRRKFADYVSALRHNNLWFYNNLVWTDLCNSIIPLTKKKANEMALARKANRDGRVQVPSAAPRIREAMQKS